MTTEDAEDLASGDAPREATIIGASASLVSSATDVYVESASLARAYKDFRQTQSKRLLFLNGISGIGKSTFLRRQAGEDGDAVYVDVSLRSTKLDLFAEIYSSLRPNQDLVTRVRSEIEAPSQIYLQMRDSGNLTIKDSELQQSPVTNVVRVEVQSHIDLFTRAAYRIVTELLAHHDICLLLDQYESAVDNLEIRAAVRSLLTDCRSVSVVLASKQPIQIDEVPDDQIARYTHQKGLTDSEAEKYLSLRGVENAEIVARGIKIASGHPLFLRLVTDGVKTGLSLDGSILSASDDERFRALVSHVDRSLPRDLRKVFYRVALCRFFSKDLLRSVFSLDSSDADELIAKLRQDLYVDAIAVGGVLLFRFHELFTNLRRREVAQDEQIEFDRRVVSFYADQYSAKGHFDALSELVEPFYHLQHVSSQDAFDYFERYFKPILDRKQKSIAGVLVQQINLTLVKDPTLRSWFLLRIAGYYREFGHYEEAERILKEILSTERDDDRLTAYALNNLAICYLFTRREEQCQRALEKSNEICEQLDLPVIRAYNYNNLGMCFHHQDRLEESKDAYEKAHQLYAAQGIEGLHMGKLLQNYCGLLQSQERFDLAVTSALAAEQEYLRDADLVAGILCRMLAAECMLSLSRYDEAFTSIDGGRKTFKSILASSGVSNYRFHFLFVSAMLWLYHNRPDAFVSEFLEALALALVAFRPSSIERVLWDLATLPIRSGHPDVIRVIANRICDNKIFGSFDQQIRETLEYLLTQRWWIRAEDGMHHRPGCDRYRRGHYLRNTAVVSPGDLLMVEDFSTCDCVRHLRRQATLPNSGAQ